MTRASDAGYYPVMYVPRSALKITGPAAIYFDVKAESGRLVQRGTCSSCGSNLFILAELVPGMRGLWADSLDDPSDFQDQRLDAQFASVERALDPTMKKLAVAPNEAQFKDLLDEAAAALQPAV